MTSTRQISANQQNARRSTGPTSKAGKARAARNARRHGLTAAPAEEEVEKWLCAILNRREPPSPVEFAIRPGLHLAYRLAQAEARLAMLRRTIFSETEPIDLEDPNDKAREEIRADIARVLNEPEKYGDSLAEVMTRLELLNEIQRELGNEIRLSNRYLREARAERKRAFRDWMSWERQGIAHG